MITETWDLKSETHWACGRPMSPYKGAYPVGFLKRLDKKIGLQEKKILTLFCGSSNYGDTVDINPDVTPKYVADCRNNLPIASNIYDVVIADPPYDCQNINYSSKLYNQEFVKPYSFVNEMVRVCKVGGLICILHQLVYKTLDGTERFAVIPITTGPNQRIRVLNIFKKNIDVNQVKAEPRKSLIDFLDQHYPDVSIDSPIMIYKLFEKFVLKEKNR